MSLKNNTQKRRRGLLNYLRRNITKKYLKRCSKEHLKSHEQLVVFSFDYISRMIALEGQYETNELALIRNTFAHFLQDKTILDVGANIGNHTVAFSKIAKDVVAFEPNPLVFELLKNKYKKAKKCVDF
jgi:predicted RNA methylase